MMMITVISIIHRLEEISDCGDMKEY